jgi:hypothetical protein
LTRAGRHERAAAEVHHAFEPAHHERVAARVRGDGQLEPSSMQAFVPARQIPTPSVPDGPS